MLHKDVLMADIDVDQWRNAQSLLLRSAKAARRIVVIHEAGRVLKLRHTDGIPVAGTVTTVDDPAGVARELYRANADTTDLVVVLDRDDVDAYFASIQDAWDIDADLDAFVQNTYATIDSFPAGIVTHPGPARSQLGLQWRIGASLQEVEAAARAHVAPGTTAVLGVYDAGALWTSLVLDLDEEWKVTSVTTADPSLVDIAGPRDEVLDRLVTWQRDRGREVSYALLLDRAVAEEFLAATGVDKAAVLTGALSSGTASIREGAARG
ncbi:hypothetical protein [Cellulomonas denverensis]|uniref:Uncharacterized protein n=1 Tax=Cellulomonas denverensis TaxID=264297 RepID=A0A7X6KXH5_9CELL|nr:hypothetical protein [Cellulomonas denverensis]NKY24003.1 hypothetical protein [Cellulomonas denverensis]GIG27257.1 hypothetical protein Cde04nite_35010 [Cellulomonas denverensis]